MHDTLRPSPIEVALTPEDAQAIRDRLAEIVLKATEDADDLQQQFALYVKGGHRTPSIERNFRTLTLSARSVENNFKSVVEFLGSGEKIELAPKIEVGAVSPFTHSVTGRSSGTNYRVELHFENEDANMLLHALMPIPVPEGKNPGGHPHLNERRTLTIIPPRPQQG